MRVVYFSLTGNIERFVNKLNISIPIEVGHIDLITEEPFILITYTAKFGEIPESVKLFLEKNENNLRAVIGSGNRN